MKFRRQQLSLSLRPRNFGQFVGQEKLLQEILEDRNSEQETTRYLFYGQPGSGKTSLARVMALSLQCSHSKFGWPCRDCRKNSSQFNIRSVPCAKLTADGNKTAVEVLEDFLSGVRDYPSIGSRKKIWILDEPQRLSPAAQEYLLEVLEDAPRTSVFFLCTTRRSALIRAMRRRCVPYKLRPLEEQDIRKLIDQTLEKLGVKEKLSSLRLCESLVENGISSPGFIMVAIQKYVSGASPQEAAQVDQDSEFDHKSLTRCITRGDWNDARQQLKLATPEDARGIRTGVSAYLRSILVESENMDGNADVVAKAIDQLSRSTDDGVLLPLVTSTVYALCKKFRRNPR